jgi:hypothetical protein
VALASERTIDIEIVPIKLERLWKAGVAYESLAEKKHLLRFSKVENA